MPQHGDPTPTTFTPLHAFATMTTFERTCVFPSKFQQADFSCVGQVPSFDSRVAMLLLEKELGAPWTSFFAELSPEPIAAASLGQVGSTVVPQVHEYCRS